MLRKHLFKHLLALVALVSNYAYAASCDFTVQSEWGTGFTSSVTITNDTNQVINDWVVSLDFAGSATTSNMWNASLSGSGPYQAASKPYNRTIQPNSSVQFGFNAIKTTSGTPALAPTLGGICAASTGDKPPTAIASSSPLSGDIPLTVHFDATASTDPEGNALSYLWEFEDGSTATSATPSRTFSQAGTHTIKLTVSDGSLDSSTISIIVDAQLPEPTTAQCEYVLRSEWNTGYTSALKITNVSPQAINSWTVSMRFEDEASISNIWNADLSGSNPYQATNKSYNGTIAANSTIEFGFNSRKAVTGRAAIPPTLGGICGELEVDNQPPQASAEVSPLEGDAPLLVTFNASGSSDPEGDNLSYRWDFGDGNTSSDVIATHRYSNTGRYAALLTVTDTEQNTDTVSVGITVTEAPPPPPTVSYALDTARSSLHFVSTKKTHVVETHTFTELSGGISPEGEAVLRINLNSVDTGVSIRNQRMRDYLFETASFGEAEVTLDVDMDTLATLSIGETLEQAITPVVNLHGVSLAVATTVTMTRLSADAILVQNTQPILLNATDFGLTDGIETLRSLASLSVISHVVPINITLIFNTP